MEYKYTQNKNYEDFACGRVIYHVTGSPTFPVRLSLELYEKCRHYLNKKTDLCVYDCCCGSAYMLTVLGFLKKDTISKIIASDIDPKFIKLATDNLSLLTKEGMKKRKEKLTEMYQEFGKASHLEALQSLAKLENLLPDNIQTEIFEANALETLSPSSIPDIILTDVPYGNLVEWSEGTGGVNQMMEVLAEVCGPNTVVCICMDKKQKLTTDKFIRLEKQMIGKRKFEIYQRA